MSELIQLGDKIDTLEKEFLNFEQVSCNVVHSFGPGTYIRELTVPADSYVIGHHQNFDHLNIFLKGKVSIVNEDKSITVLTAPMTFIGKPGRKVGYVHEEMVWLNVYPTDERDVEKLEAHLLTKSNGWIESSESIEAIGLLDNKVNHDDFESAISELGFTKEVVLSQSENTDDLIELPFGSYKIKVSDSKIQGKGLFATSDINEGELIAQSIIDGKRTTAERFTNHSKSPNAKMVETENGNINLVATRKIKGCFGGFNGEEITINYREAVKLTLKIKSEVKCQE
ncbi:SET domain containing protein [uncultured Caudovirales phage]|uniref:SET domain containing protein n=1 Tax=uncultured Caudovirales phage TaxID=2100421 RepID=A0A6J5MYR8_9CAUD|nr:SET domain containing protein [uncultured Caudovirales phage]